MYVVIFCGLFKDAFNVHAVGKCALCCSWPTSLCRTCLVRFVLIISEFIVAENSCRKCFCRLQVRRQQGGAPSLHPVWWPQPNRHPNLPAGAALTSRWPTESDSRQDKDGAKTSHRLYLSLCLPLSRSHSLTLSLFFLIGKGRKGRQKLCCSVAGCLPHQHTAAITRGHQQWPVKEKHWAHCFIHDDPQAGASLSPTRTSAVQYTQQLTRLYRACGHAHIETPTARTPHS